MRHGAIKQARARSPLSSCTKAACRRRRLDGGAAHDLESAPRSATRLRGRYEDSETLTLDAARSNGFAFTMTGSLRAGILWNPMSLDGPTAARCGPAATALVPPSTVVAPTDVPQSDNADPIAGAPARGCVLKTYRGGKHPQAVGCLWGLFFRVHRSECVARHILLPIPRGRALYSCNRQKDSRAMP